MNPPSRRRRDCFAPYVTGRPTSCLDEPAVTKTAGPKGGAYCDMCVGLDEPAVTKTAGRATTFR